MKQHVTFSSRRSVLIAIASLIGILLVALLPGRLGSVKGQTVTIPTQSGSPFTGGVIVITGSNVVIVGLGASDFSLGPPIPPGVTCGFTLTILNPTQTQVTVTCTPVALAAGKTINVLYKGQPYITLTLDKNGMATFTIGGTPKYAGAQHSDQALVSAAQDTQTSAAAVQSTPTTVAHDSGAGSRTPLLAAGVAAAILIAGAGLFKLKSRGR